MCKNQYIIKVYLKLIYLIIKNDFKTIFRRVIKSSSLSFLTKHVVNIDGLFSIRNVHYSNTVFNTIFKLDEKQVINKQYL